MGYYFEVFNDSFAKYRIEIREYFNGHLIETIEGDRNVLKGNIREVMYRWIVQNNKQSRFFDLEGLPDEIQGIKKSFGFFYLLGNTRTLVTCYEKISIFHEQGQKAYNVYNKNENFIGQYADKAELVKLLEKYFKENKLRIII